MAVESETAVGHRLVWALHIATATTTIQLAQEPTWDPIVTIAMTCPMIRLVLVVIWPWIATMARVFISGVVAFAKGAATEAHVTNRTTIEHSQHGAIRCTLRHESSDGQIEPRLHGVPPTEALLRLIKHVVAVAAPRFEDEVVGGLIRFVVEEVKQSKGHVH